MAKYTKLKPLSLKNHPTLNERWLQEIIAEDPTVLGIGDVVLKDKERIHSGGGRLDLLLQDADGHGRYEVELQLGATDESHVIRTLEYWDIERRRYPQYDHTAVIVAEDVTSRFLNVISLFNGFIPLMAIRVAAIETADGVGLQFTKILDTVRLGYLDEDEETAQLTDRAYWESKGTAKTVALADEVLKLAQGIESKTELSYNKHYIGFWVAGRAFNFAIMRPNKSHLRLEISLPKEDVYDQLIEDSGLDFLDYDKRWAKYRLRLTPADLKKHEDVISNLLRTAYGLRA